MAGSDVEAADGDAPPAGAARLFVAAWPPPEVLDRLEGLPRPDEPGVRWLPRASWHVTLRFLGHADLALAAAALDRLAHPPVTAVLGPAVSRLGRSVVCVPVAGLEGLAAAVVAVTAHVGEPPEPRRFAGHLTLARLRHRAACGVAGTPVHDRFTVDELHLVRSRLDHAGARYDTVHRVLLRA